MKYYGMDISSLQCVVDENIKRKNINFVILRATYGLSGVDPRFFENAEKLNRFNIPIGVYHSLCADNIYDSSAEAKYCISKISKFNIEYPVCLDINDSNISFQCDFTPSEIFYIDNISVLDLKDLEILRIDHIIHIKEISHASTPSATR